jgi:hypothetical protein
MPEKKLSTALQEELGSLPDPLDEETLARILSDPQQQHLAEAIAADILDAAPIAGDLAAYIRIKEAEEQGIEYPERPTAVENILSDIPAPLDTIGDIAVSQNVTSYMQRKYGIDLPTPVEDATEASADDVKNAIEDFAK